MLNFSSRGSRGVAVLKNREGRRPRRPPERGKKERAGERKALTGEKAATEFLDVVREELAGVDSRLQPSTSWRQASTSRRRFVASRAARVAPPPRDLATAAVAVGFDPEGWTRGLDLTVWAGLGNETAIFFFPEPGRNERRF
jgi:hypothetical protein